MGGTQRACPGRRLLHVAGCAAAATASPEAGAESLPADDGTTWNRSAGLGSWLLTRLRLWAGGRPLLALHGLQQPLHPVPQPQGAAQLQAAALQGRRRRSAGRVLARSRGERAQHGRQERGRLAAALCGRPQQPAGPRRLGWQQRRRQREGRCGRDSQHCGRARRCRGQPESLGMAACEQRGRPLLQGRPATAMHARPRQQPGLRATLLHNSTAVHARPRQQPGLRVALLRGSVFSSQAAPLAGLARLPLHALLAPLGVPRQARAAAQLAAIKLAQRVRP